MVKNSCLWVKLVCVRAYVCYDLLLKWLYISWVVVVPLIMALGR